MITRFLKFSKRFHTTNCINEIPVDDYTSQVCTIKWYTVGFFTYNGIIKFKNLLASFH